MTTRGRYRAARTARHLGNAVWVAALLLPLLIIVAALTANANGGYVDHYNYQGSRFYDMTAKICVEDRANEVKAAGKSKYISSAVKHVNDTTAARLVYRYGKGSCSGTGYKYRILITDGNYDFKGWMIVDSGPTCSSTRQSHCKRWGQTPAGNWTWLYTRYVVIRLDTDGRKLIPGSRKPWAHELGHAVLGLSDYPTNVYGKNTCNSLMAYCYSGTGLHKNDIAWFNRIRVQ